MNDKQILDISSDTFWEKIKRFFCNIKMKLFGSKKNIEEVEKMIYTQSEDTDEFIATLKNNYNFKDSKFEKSKFLKEINGNIDALEMLSTDRLKKLSEYYDEVIEKNNKIINRLKN